MTENALVVVHLLEGSGICTWSKPIKAKVISLSTSFLFFNSFLILKRNSTAATGVVLLKKLFLKGSEYSQIPVLQSPFLIKLLGFKTVARLAFYMHTWDLIFLSVKIHQLFVNFVFLKNVKSKFMFRCN